MWLGGKKKREKKREHKHYVLSSVVVFLLSKLDPSAKGGNKSDERGRRFSDFNFGGLRDASVQPHIRKPPCTLT